MARLVIIVVLSLFASTAAFAQKAASLESEACGSQPVNGRICVSEEILSRFLVRRVAPKLADANVAHGEVVLRVLIGEKGGKPSRISVISGNPTLTSPAVHAVGQWLFKPYIYNGQYVQMQGDVRLRFPDRGNTR